ncbi:copper-binding protein [Acidovorax sp. LjRoot194]|uniref:copper-binding protein n=1 Tax=Acidovorax sp. LjRoot194 TaxID=3342280 RepID=UPI003ECF82B9
MKTATNFLMGAALSLAALLPVAASAQASADAGKSASAPAASMTEGEVRKIDKEAGKITIKHGDIKHLEMPGMTMVFAAKDKALLDKAQVGDKIRFMVVSEAGKMIVTDIEPAK